MTKEFLKASTLRALRTFIQTILAIWTTGQLITEVNWKFALISAVSASVYSLLTSILTSLPEVRLEETLYSLDNEADEEYMNFVDEIDETIDEEGDA